MKAEFTRDWFMYGKPEAFRLRLERELGQHVMARETQFGQVLVLRNRWQEKDFGQALILRNRWAS